jgi:hypothetical protein
MRLWIACLLVLITFAHIAMWTSDMPRDLALRLTLINAAGWAVILLPAWAVILLPAWAVSKWAAAHKHR